MQFFCAETQKACIFDLQLGCILGGASQGGDVLFCRTKENQKGRRCPEGMKAPVGLLSRRPVCEANAVCSARQGHGDFDALEPGGDCSLLAPKENQKSASDFDALDPRERGYSPLSTPKRMGSIQKKLAASLNAFLCSAISRPLSRCGGSSPQGSGCALSVCSRWSHPPLPLGELANPKGLTERAKGSPFGRAGAKRLRGFVPPQGASGSRYRSPLRPFP